MRGFALAIAVVLAFGAGLPTSPAVAQSVNDPSSIVAKALHEETVRIEVTVTDLYGREESRMPITIFRPAGDGPYPLVVFNHGRAAAERRARAQGFCQRSGRACRPYAVDDDVVWTEH